MTESGASPKKDLSAEQFERFRDWIHKHSGIYLEETKLDSLRISLLTRATRFGFFDYDEYYSMLLSSEDEFKELMNLVTINETSFFRFPAQFDALRDLVIPEILERKSNLGRSFRAWSAGCSTGEEPYTIAMTLLDSALESTGHRCEVMGTDVSTQALDRAREAVYPARSLANLPQDVVQRWFEPVKGGHRPVRRVRDIVDLSYHNLVKEPYPLALLSNWDLIFCRNVTIYFRPESTRRVVDNFFESLNPGGYLFIGHSETLTTISDRFEPVELGGVFLYRKPMRRIHSFDSVAKRRTEDTDRPTVAEPNAANASPASAVTSRPETASQAAELVAAAQELLEQGRPVEARAAAEKALQIEPRSVEAMLVRAYAHADSGDFVEAITEANAALAIDPLHAPARYILGIIYQRQGDTMAALNEFKRTIYIDHEFVLAHFNAANIHRARGAIDDARREYENTLRALYANPSGSWTVFLGGFRPDLLSKTVERSLIECRRGTSQP
ncbi:MAG TPA: CheR family methyltransferase [Coriobacteriia bacterium]